MSTNAFGLASRFLQEQLPHLVRLPGSEEYEKDTDRFIESAKVPSICSVRPSSVEEIGEILKIVGRNDVRCPFAIKSGGHALSLGTTSSTEGIVISMANFTEITYDEKLQNVKMGAGLTWERVYKELEKYEVTVAGGRTWGVGTGLLLGGGYSWLTEEHGLSSDTVLAYDLVKPDGTFAEVTETSEPDLFFALKGGMNKFGIVTSFTLKAYPIGTIWAGMVTYSMEHNEEVLEALADFSATNVDAKAVLLACYALENPEPIWRFTFFYNGETEPEAFKRFMQIPSIERDIGPRSLYDFLEMSRSPPNALGAAHTLPIRTYTLPLLRKIQKLHGEFFRRTSAEGRSITGVSFTAEPFKAAYSKSIPSAHPHSLDSPLCPSLLWMEFSNFEDVLYVHASLWQLGKDIQKAGIDEGQCKPEDVYYPNYAVGETPLELLYGDNLQRLQEIRAKVDPNGVMQLTGGFKI